jgi:Leucine-rich repeat (LRR) protein
LTTLPLSLRELTRLVRLNLRANRIESIPFVFHSVVALQSLDLSSNALSEWPLALDATLLRSCRALMLANNKISLVPSLLLGELPRLEYISLHHNPLTNYTASSTFDSTSLLKSMRALRARTDDAPLHPVRVLILGKEKVGKTS